MAEIFVKSEKQVASLKFILKIIILAKLIERL